MLAFVASLLLALAPQPSTGPDNDFNAVVYTIETANSCKAISMTEPSKGVREVLFRCEKIDVRAVLAFVPGDGWFLIMSHPEPREKPQGKDI